MHAAIELHRVTKTFGTLRAVDDLSLTVRRGELMGFLGPNGAGKTTTIKMLSGLLRPTSGEVRVFGVDPVSDGAEVRRRLAYIPDTPYLYERLTAGEFFEFSGRLFGIDPGELGAARERLFAELGLCESADTLIKDLSHGQRQRLIYAAALARRPDLYLIDEPFIGLDPRGIRQIKDLLRKSTATGATVFLTTHILALIEDLVDRVAILRNGRLVACGTVDELKAAAPAARDLEDVFLDLTAGTS